jgi:hypothetical protein
LSPARLLPVIFALCCAILPGCAQTSFEHVIHSLYGGTVLYRGHELWVEISHNWLQTVPFSVDPSTSHIIAPGHPFRASSEVWVTPDLPLPFPLSERVTYGLCDLDGDRFQIHPPGGGCSSPETIVHFEPGFETTARIGMRVASGRPSVYLRDIEGVPLGVTVEIFCGSLRCPFQNAAQRYVSSGGGLPFQFRFRASRTAPLGPATIRAVVETEGHPPRPVEIKINVEPLLPVKLDKPADTDYTPIPGVDRWEEQMERLAPKWCKLTAIPEMKMAFGVEGQVWFYDGAWVYFQIADYLKNPVWRECGLAIASQYRDYAINLRGNVPGWRVFVDGLAKAYELTGDDTYKDAIRLIANRSATFGTKINDAQIREMSYFLEAMVMHERLSGERPPQLERVADQVLGMLDSLFISRNFNRHQIFMDGLAMKALIHYYDLTKDARVPVTIKAALDDIWINSWDDQAKGLYVNPNPKGPFCTWGCQQPDTTLINLTAPAYAWFFSITGDTTYRDRGDTLFQHSMDAPFSYSGKAFSQNYRWSFDYIRWRTRPAGKN